MDAFYGILSRFSTPSPLWDHPSYWKTTYSIIINLRWPLKRRKLLQTCSYVNKSEGGWISNNGEPLLVKIFLHFPKCRNFLNVFSWNCYKLSDHFGKKMFSYRMCFVISSPDCMCNIIYLTSSFPTTGGVLLALFTVFPGLSREPCTSSSTQNEADESAISQRLKGILAFPSKTGWQKQFH